MDLCFWACFCGIKFWIIWGLPFYNRLFSPSLEAGPQKERLFPKIFGCWFQRRSNCFLKWTLNEDVFPIEHVIYPRIVEAHALFPIVWTHTSKKYFLLMDPNFLLNPWIPHCFPRDGCFHQASLERSRWLQRFTGRHRLATPHSLSEAGENW